MNTNISLKKKLSVGFSLISLFSLALCGVASYYFTGALIQRLTVKNLNDQIMGVDSAIRVSFGENQDHQNKLMEYWGAKVNGMVGVDRGRTQNKLIENQVTHDKNTMSIPVLTLDGKNIDSHEFVDRVAGEVGTAVTLFINVPEKGLVRASTSIRNKEGLRLIDTMIPTSSEVYKTIAEGKRYLGRAQVMGTWYVTSYEPLTKDGKLIGAFFMGVPETSSARIKGFLKEQKILQSGYFYILDSQGNFLLHPNKEGQNVLETTDVDGQFIFKKIISEKNGSVEYRWLNPNDQNPQNKLAIFHYFPQLDWYVVASLNKEEVNAPLIELKWILISISLTLTFLMALAAIFFGHQISTKLNAIASVLKNSYENVSGNSAMLLENSDRVAEATTQQGASLQITAAAIEQIEATLNRNQETTKVAEDLTKGMTETVQNGQSSLDRLTESIQMIDQNMQHMHSEIDQNYSQLESIVKIIANIETKTEVINQIVFQTKLLSFNASVEAARAGENGRGFSVVAEEVGRLAMMSGTAANEIRTNLESSRTEIQNIVAEAKRRVQDMIKQSTPLTKSGVKNSKDCREDFSKIMVQVGEVSESVKSINAASIEQTKGMREISKAIREIDTSTKVNSSAAEKVQDLSHHLQQGSEELKKSVFTLEFIVNGTDSGDARAKNEAA